MLEDIPICSLHPAQRPSLEVMPHQSWSVCQGTAPQFLKALRILTFKYDAVAVGSAVISAAEIASQSASTYGVKDASNNSNMLDQVCTICIHISAIRRGGTIYLNARHTPLFFLTLVGDVLDFPSATTSTTTTGYGVVDLASSSLSSSSSTSSSSSLFSIIYKLFSIFWLFVQYLFSWYQLLRM